MGILKSSYRTSTLSRPLLGPKWIVTLGLGLGLLMLAGMQFRVTTCAAERLTADQILDHTENNLALTGSGTATIDLITENKRGQQRTYKLRVFRREDPDGSDKQLVEYLSPADVAGTKFLSITKEGSDAQMWLFMPALGRERRMAGSATREKFMGTDFTYEEIGSASSYKKDYRAERLPDETLDGRKCYVLRLSPKGDSDFSYLKMWVWQDEFVPLKIEFYDVDGRLKKVLANSDLRKNEKGKWEPRRLIMSDILGGTKTTVVLIETKEEKVADEYFSMRYLRRK
ncbi:MAG: outer membrane lipoprotein-sorting protein [Firmicutes bacterium]|nr:outer membrane lipoprotein-sorting protein [Bacillota bacterium]